MRLPRLSKLEWGLIVGVLLLIGFAVAGGIEQSKHDQYDSGERVMFMIKVGDVLVPQYHPVMKCHDWCRRCAELRGDE